MEQPIILVSLTEYMRMLGILRDWKRQAQTGDPLSVYVRAASAQRSSQANRRYWHILQRIAEAAAPAGKRFSKEAWHAYFAGEFIGWEDIPLVGGRSPCSTSKLSVAEFADYVAKVEAWAAQEGVDIGD